jgi:hypothetical protein
MPIQSLESPRVHSLTPLLLLGVLAVFVRCSSDFLHPADKSVFQVSDTLVISDRQVSQVVMLYLPQVGSSNCMVYSFPKWMRPLTFSGTFERGYFQLSFELVQLEYYDYGTFIHELVIEVADYGYISIPVLFKRYGYPSVTAPMSVELAESPVKSFPLYNSGEGILEWKFEDIPSWLTLLPDHGVLPAGHTVNIWAYVDRTGLIETFYGQQVRLEHNGMNEVNGIPFSITNRTLQFSIPGVVTGADFSDEADRLFFCTRDPHRLYVFEVATRSLQEIPLQAEPVCLAPASGGTRVILGMKNNSLAEVDVLQGQISHTYDIDCIPYDLVVSGDWCHLSPLYSSYGALRSYCFSTGEMVYGPYVSGRFDLSKIPGRPLLFGMAADYSPGGLDFIEIRNGPMKDSIDHLHAGYYPYRLSADGTEIYMINGEIYRMPQFDANHNRTSQHELIQTLQTRQSYFVSIDECSAQWTIFAAEEESSAELPPLVTRYNRSTYYYSTACQIRPYIIESPAGKTVCHTFPAYIFASERGSYLLVIKNIARNYAIQHMWGLDVIPID